MKFWCVTADNKYYINSANSGTPESVKRYFNDIFTWLDVSDVVEVTEDEYKRNNKWDVKD